MRKAFTLIELMIVLAVIIIVLTLCVGGCATALHNVPGQTFTVTGKENVKNGESGKYLIYTDKTTYEITDSWYHWRWDSSDVYGSIQVGKTYSATLQGYRVPFLSWYPNVISPTEVTKEVEKK
jgi:prepilin-type N-terminal cleavage/methylation domain-containing protein